MAPTCFSEPYTPVHVATRMVLYGIIYLLAETCGSRNVLINPIQNYASRAILTAVVPFQSPTVTHRHQNSFTLIVVYYKILQLQTLWHHAGLINTLIKHRQFCKEGHYVIHYCCRERARMTNWQPLQPLHFLLYDDESVVSFDFSSVGKASMTGGYGYNACFGAVLARFSTKKPFWRRDDITGTAVPSLVYEAAIQMRLYSGGLEFILHNYFLHSRVSMATARS